MRAKHDVHPKRLEARDDGPRTSSEDRGGELGAIREQREKALPHYKLNLNI